MKSSRHFEAYIRSINSEWKAVFSVAEIHSISDCICAYSKTTRKNTQRSKEKKKLIKLYLNEFANVLDKESGERESRIRDFCTLPT